MEEKEKETATTYLIKSTVVNNFVKQIGPWWSNGLGHYSFVLVMLKVESSNPGFAIYFY